MAQCLTYTLCLTLCINIYNIIQKFLVNKIWFFKTFFFQKYQNFYSAMMH